MGKAITKTNFQFDSLPCLRCGTTLVFAGHFKFHEGAKWGLGGQLFELFVNRVSFDVYKCPECGKVEFYTPRTDRIYL